MNILLKIMWNVSALKCFWIVNLCVRLKLASLFVFVIGTLLYILVHVLLLNKKNWYGPTGFVITQHILFHTKLMYCKLIEHGYEYKLLHKWFMELCHGFDIGSIYDWFFFELPSSDSYLACNIHYTDIKNIVRPRSLKKKECHKSRTQTHVLLSMLCLMRKHPHDQLPPRLHSSYDILSWPCHVHHLGHRLHPPSGVAALPGCKCCADTHKRGTTGCTS